jgi:hypothetical protein
MAARSSRMSTAKRAKAVRKGAKPSKKAARKGKAASARPKAAAKRPASRRPAPAMAGRPGHARCAATDPFGDPCQNVPRRPSAYCVIHSYLDR